MNRVDRLMNILWTIQSQKFVPIDKIAKKHDLSHRTIYRDIRALNEIGIPVYFEEGRGYTVMQGYFLPPLSFTLDEANALLLLQSLSDKFSDKSITENARSAIRKIQSVMKNNDLEKIENISNNTEVYIPGSQQNHAKAYLSDIQISLAEKRVIELKYTDAGQKKTHREIEPIGLIFYTNQWHLIAWCRLRKGYRDFKVNAITLLKLTGEPFKKKHTYTIQDYMKIFETPVSLT